MQPRQATLQKIATALEMPMEDVMRWLLPDSPPPDPNAPVLPPLVKGATFISPDRGVYICDGKSWVLQPRHASLDDILQIQQELVQKINAFMTHIEANKEKGTHPEL